MASYTRVLSKRIEDIVSETFVAEKRGEIAAYLTRGLKEWLEAEEKTELKEAAE